MTTKRFYLAGIAVLLFSCSDDNNAITTPPLGNNENAVIDYYTIESTTTIADSGNSSGYFLTGILEDEKFFSEKYEGFVNGESQGAVTEQHFFYGDTGLLVKIDRNDDVREFFYDGQQRLVGLTWQFETSTRYYRFVPVSEGKVFFEQINLPYDNPAAVASGRIVIEFDANDNIVKAGRDNDMDGQANWNHQFSYDGEGNLTNAQEYGGIGHQIQSTPIKDTYNKILLKTYGKRNLMIYQAECYANFELEAMRHSPNLRMMDTQQATIESTGFPYYFRKHQMVSLSDPDEQRATVTSFYFK